MKKAKFPCVSGFLQVKMKNNRKKAFTFGESLCIINKQPKYGGAPDSIAGERKDKHTADGVPAQKHST